MLCPLLNPKKYKTHTGETREEGLCIKEECAWWDPANECCAVRTIVSVLSRLTKKLGEGI